MGDLAVVDSEEPMEMGEEEEDENGAVRWEDYPYKMVIRVLLVEADDSTRQIIATILRKCNYKVAATPDGLKAWEILKRRHSIIDLILTNVELPSISGYALLTLIMEHDSCKRIPVIMMSSCDSISMVFKCMLKGAADFLIKPVRKNELKNLRQHVWRRISLPDEQGQQNSPTSPCNIRTTSKSKEVRNHSIDKVPSSRKNSQSPGRASDAQDFSWLPLKQAELTSSHDKLDSCNGSMKSWKEIAALRSEREVMPIPSMRLEVGESRVDKDAQGGSTGPESRTAVGYLTDGKMQRYTRGATEAIDLIDSQHDCTSFSQHSSNNKQHGVSVAASELDLSLRSSEGPVDQVADAKKRKLDHSNASAFSCGLS